MSRGGCVGLLGRVGLQAEGWLRSEGGSDWRRHAYRARGGLVSGDKGADGGGKGVGDGAAPAYMLGPTWLPQTARLNGL